MNFLRRNRRPYDDRAYDDRTHGSREYDRTHGSRTFDDRSRSDRAYDDRRYDTTSGTAARTTSRHSREKRSRSRRSKTRRPLFDMNSGNFNRRPSFGQWLKFTWLDLLTMAAMGAVGLGVYYADPAPSRSFPITFADGQIVYPEFAYPLRTEIIPIWEAALLASLVPIAVILLMQIRIRSFWDVNNAIIGLLYSLITAAVFQVFIKWLIGGLRPHFLAVCAPNLNRVQQNGQSLGQGFGRIMFQRDICTGDRNQINDSLESMPSGHSTAAWAGFLYLYYYLNAKLKVWSNYHPAMWKLVVTYAPVLGAFLITGALTIDEFHNWYDCLAGAIIGSVMATSAYRMVYASVWDFRFNHIPLTRHTPFSFGAGEAGAGGFETAVFTRKAGWGFEEAYGGAPFDAAHHLRGVQAGFNNAVHNDHGGVGGTSTGRGRLSSRDGVNHHGGGGILGGLMGGRTHHRDGDIGHNHRNSTLDHHHRDGDVAYTQRDAGLGHHHRDGDVEYNAGSTVPGHNVTDPGQNRYKVHSRSLERKAINRDSQGPI